MANILLLGSGTQAFAILKPLRQNGHRIVLLSGDKGNYADVSRRLNKNIHTPLDVRSPEYLEIVQQVIRDERIDVVIPTGDVTAEFLSRHKDELSPLARFVAPDFGAFMAGYDKTA